MHFGERHSQFFPFCEYVLAPGKSLVEVQHEIIDIFLRMLYVALMDWGAHFSPVLNVTWSTWFH
jgi:hypothetical protein